RAPMQDKSNRRAYGSGSIIIRNGSYHGKWWLGDRQMMRRLGRVRLPGTRDGITRPEAERRLRQLMTEVSFVPPERRLTFADIAERYIDHVEQVMQRKPSTVRNYRNFLGKHLGPYFGRRDIARISPDDVASYLRIKARGGLSAKTLSNHLVFAHGVFRF